MQKIKKMTDVAILLLKRILEHTLDISSIPVYVSYEPMSNRSCIIGFGFFTIIVLHHTLVERNDLVEIRYCILHELLHHKFNHVLRAFLFSIFLPWMAKKKIMQYEAQIKKEIDKYGDTELARYNKVDPCL